MNLLLCAIEIMIVIESGGDWSAIGDGGNAKGALQTWPEVVVDCNRIIGYAKYSIADRTDPRRCREMAQIYLSHYCSEKRLGRPATLDDYVRCWNGGPNYAHAKGRKLARMNDYSIRAANLMQDQYGLALLAKRSLPIPEAKKS